jgi:hypothetical protein
MTTPRVRNMKNLVRVPDGAVYIGRANPAHGLPASRWRNPFEIRKHGSRDEVIKLYERWLYAPPDERAAMIAECGIDRALYGISDRPLIDGIAELCGVDLVCWCSPQPCHGDLLLRLANAPG